MGKKKEMDKLAWENAQALAAGMSYGKWKAKQAPVQIEKKVPECMVKCPYCGEYFKRKGTKIYCNDDCRQGAYRKKTNEIQKIAQRRRREKLKESTIDGLGL